MIPLKKPEMQGAKFSRNEAYLAYVAVTGKLKQRRRLYFGYFLKILNGVIEKIAQYSLELTLQTPNT
jgi:hypothetical protein